MFFRLALLFVLVPLIELMLLVQMGRWIGLLPTLALVVFTGILGAALARLQGLATLIRFRQALAEGRLPHREIVEGILILIAGAVLLTPGLLTDATGFLLLVPPVRRLAAKRIEGWLQRRGTVVVAGRPVAGGGGWTPPAGPVDPDVVDVEFEVKDPGKNR